MWGVGVAVLGMSDSNYHPIMCCHLWLISLVKMLSSLLLSVVLHTHQPLQTSWYNTRNINHDYLTQASFNSTICYSFHWTNFQAIFACMSEPSFLNLKLDSPRHCSWSDHRTQCIAFLLVLVQLTNIMGIFYTTTVTKAIVFQFRVLKLELTTGFNCFVI